MDLHGYFTLFVLVSISFGVNCQPVEDCCLHEMCPYYCKRCDGTAQCFDLSDELGCSPEADKKLLSHSKPPIFVPFVLKTLKAQILKEKQRVAQLYPQRQCLQRPATARPAVEPKNTYQVGEKDNTQVWSLMLKKLNKLSTTARPTTTEQPIWLQLLNKLKAEKMGLTTPTTTTTRAPPTTENPTWLYLLKSLVDMATANSSTTQTPPIVTTTQSPSTQPPTTVTEFIEFTTEIYVDETTADSGIHRSTTLSTTTTPVEHVVSKATTTPSPLKPAYSNITTVSSDIDLSGNNISIRSNNITQASTTATAIEPLPTKTPVQSDPHNITDTDGMVITTEALPNITEWIEALYRAGNETVMSTTIDPLTTPYQPAKPFVFEPSDASRQNASDVENTVYSVSPSLENLGLINAGNISAMNLTINNTNMTKAVRNDMSNTMTTTESVTITIPNFSKTNMEQSLNNVQNTTKAVNTNMRGAEAFGNTTLVPSETIYKSQQPSDNNTESVTTYTMSSVITDINHNFTINYTQLRNNVTFNTTENVTGFPILMKEDGTGKLFDVSVSSTEGNVTPKNVTGYPINVYDILASHENGIATENNSSLYTGGKAIESLTKWIRSDKFHIGRIETKPTRMVNSTQTPYITKAGTLKILDLNDTSTNTDSNVFPSTTHYTHTSVIDTHQTTTDSNDTNHLSHSTNISTTSIPLSMSSTETQTVQNTISMAMNATEEKRFDNTTNQEKGRAFILNKRIQVQFTNESEGLGNNQISNNSIVQPIGVYVNNSYAVRLIKEFNSSVNINSTKMHILNPLQYLNNSTTHITDKKDLTNTTTTQYKNTPPLVTPRETPVMTSAVTPRETPVMTSADVTETLVTEPPVAISYSTFTEVNTASPLSSTESEYAILLREVRKTLSATKARISRIADELKSINKSEQVSASIAVGGLANKTSAPKTNLFKYGLLSDFQTNDAYYNFSVNGRDESKPILQEASSANTVTTSITRQKIDTQSNKPTMVTSPPWTYQTTTFPFDNFWDTITTQPLFVDSVWNPMPPNTIWSSFFDNWNTGSMGVQSTAKTRNFQLPVTESPIVATTPRPFIFTSVPSKPPNTANAQIPVINTQDKTNNVLKNLMSVDGVVSISTERSEGLQPFNPSLDLGVQSILSRTTKLPDDKSVPYASVTRENATPIIDSVSRTSKLPDDKAVPYTSETRGDIIPIISVVEERYITTTQRPIDVTTSLPSIEKDNMNRAGISSELQPSDTISLSAIERSEIVNVTSIYSASTESINQTERMTQGISPSDTVYVNITNRFGNFIQNISKPSTMYTSSKPTDNWSSGLQKRGEEMSKSKEQHGRVHSNIPSSNNGVPISIEQWGSLIATRPSYTNSQKPSQSAPLNSVSPTRPPSLGSVIPSRPPLNSVSPTRPPSLGSVIPSRPPLNSVSPTRPPSLGSVIPSRPPTLGNLIPNLNPSVGGGVIRSAKLNITIPSKVSPFNNSELPSTSIYSDQPVPEIQPPSKPVDEVVTKDYVIFQSNQTSPNDTPTAKVITSNLTSFTDNGWAVTQQSGDVFPTLSTQFQEVIPTHISSTIAWQPMDIFSTISSQFADASSSSISPQSTDTQSTTAPQSKDALSSITSQYGDLQSTIASQSRGLSSTSPIASQSSNFRSTMASRIEDASSIISLQSGAASTTLSSQSSRSKPTIAPKLQPLYGDVSSNIAFQSRDSQSTKSTQTGDVQSTISAGTGGTAANSQFAIGGSLSSLYKGARTDLGSNFVIRLGTLMSTPAPDSKEMTAGDASDDVYPAEFSHTSSINKPVFLTTTQKPLSSPFTVTSPRSVVTTRRPVTRAPGVPSRSADSEKHDWFDKAFQPTTWYPFETQYPTNTPIPWNAIHKQKLTKTVDEVPTTTAAAASTDNGCLLLQDASDFCKELLSGQYKNPDNCSTYFVCDWGDLYRCFCPPKTLFDNKLRVCNWDYAVEC